MPILDQYGNAIPPERIEERSTLANPDPAFSEIFAAPTSAGPTVTPDTALRSTAVYAAAFASPFFFLALFPSWLAGLPKSGGWLNAVKVVLGLAMVAEEQMNCGEDP